MNANTTKPTPAQLRIEALLDARIDARIRLRDPVLLKLIDERIQAGVQQALIEAFGGFGVAGATVVDVQPDGTAEATTVPHDILPPIDAIKVANGPVTTPVASPPETPSRYGLVEFPRPGGFVARAINEIFPPALNPTGPVVITPLVGDASLLEPVAPDVGESAEVADADEDEVHQPIPQSIPGRAGRKQRPLVDCAPSTQVTKLRDINAERTKMGLKPFETVEEGIRAQAASGLTERLRIARGKPVGDPLVPCDREPDDAPPAPPAAPEAPLAAAPLVVTDELGIPVVPPDAVAADATTPEWGGAL